MTELQDMEQIWADHAARLATVSFPDALGPGERAPNFELPNAHSEPVRLAALLQSGPVVLVFYRGAWCPYCNTQLRALQASLDRIAPLGATLVAVSPQTPDASTAFAEQAELQFEVLSDVNSYVASDYGITFELSERDRELFVSAGNDLSHVNGSDPWILPAPSTFVIAADGVIEYARVDADYRIRAEVEEVIAVVGAVSSR